MVICLHVYKKELIILVRGVASFFLEIKIVDIVE